ncbi:MAG: arabinogalactan endo-1,4-beta-galactosidase [Saprospiraceae bacterium]|nr:arabinogalactan endo-1,4-beta-galactosidase [Saprospiraceae bacterium]MDW8483278.1 glycosyl hydrolase 53 family protein [Saprospiraceae bacterium]
MFSYLKLGRYWAKRAGMLLFVLASSCYKSSVPSAPAASVQEDDFIIAADLSTYPEIERGGLTFYAEDGRAEDFLKILRTSGINTVRLRLWVDPPNGHCGLEEVQHFAKRLRKMGFRLWLALHYADTWADPARQQTPARWQSLSFTALKDSVHHYTWQVAEWLKPEFIQLGNEINAGFLHPLGHSAHYPQQFRQFLSIAAQAVRMASPTTKIILHFAGLENALEFYASLIDVDFDVIGLSYYPIWHGKSLYKLQTTLAQLSQYKPVVVAETAYPFTLGWNDWTTNIVGLPEHLILPDYPATPEGQRAFVESIRSVVRRVPKGIGFCYWGGEWVAWKGPTATDGSPWENQALFDFKYRALPALKAFKEE